MAVNFPEITSFGTLLKFALALEDTAAHLMTRAAEGDESAVLRNNLAACARKHAKRAEQLERLRRERLNEVVLQAIEGMDGGEYVSALELSSDTETRLTIARLIALEEAMARFYDDAAVTAANVLAGVERTFRRLAKESGSMAATLRES